MALVTGLRVMREGGQICERINKASAINKVLARHPYTGKLVFSTVRERRLFLLAQRNKEYEVSGI